MFVVEKRVGVGFVGFLIFRFGMWWTVGSFCGFLRWGGLKIGG